MAFWAPLAISPAVAGAMLLTELGAFLWQEARARRQEEEAEEERARAAAQVQQELKTQMEHEARKQEKAIARLKKQMR